MTTEPTTPVRAPDFVEPIGNGELGPIGISTETTTGNTGATGATGPIGTINLN